MNFDTWMKGLPPEITEDSLWKMEACRLALFLADTAWFDVSKLADDRRTADLAGQLYRAAGSIEANISEGYSRSSGRDRTRFYEYSLGSARESRGWCFKGRHVLSAAVIDHRLQLVTHVIRLLLTMIPNQRTSSCSLSEQGSDYQVSATDEAPLSPMRISHLQESISMP